MINHYSQHHIAKLCNETDTSISRIVERSLIRPTVTLGLRLLYNEAQKNEVVHLVGEYRRRVPRIPRTKKGSTTQ